jgi:GntR family transcriptional regulator
MADSEAGGACMMRHFLVDRTNRRKLFVYLYRQMNSSRPFRRFSRSGSKSLPGLVAADPVPLHAQIERELRRMMALPEFQKGALFPDELTLANRFGVSRGTVRVALTRLVNQRLLERKPGVGTRVLPIPAESSIGEWRSFSREMARRNISVESYFLDARRFAAPDRVAQALQITAGTEVLRLDRVRGWANRPVLHSRSWFHPRLRLAEAADFSKPLYELIQAETGSVADSAREELSAVPAAAALARHLKVPTGEPLLLRCHTVFDTGKRPMEFAEVHYVSARFTLTLDLKREAP